MSSFHYSPFFSSLPRSPLFLSLPFLFLSSRSLLSFPYPSPIVSNLEPYHLVKALYPALSAYSDPNSRTRPAIFLSGQAVDQSDGSILLLDALNEVVVYYRKKGKGMHCSSNHTVIKRCACLLELSACWLHLCFVLSYLPFTRTPEHPDIRYHAAPHATDHLFCFLLLWLMASRLLAFISSLHHALICSPAFS